MALPHFVRVERVTRPCAGGVAPAGAAHCQGVCGCGVPCELRCNIGAVVTTFGAEHLCIDYCRAPSAPQASVSEELEASGDAAPVCEEPQASESAPSAES